MSKFSLYVKYLLFSAVCFIFAVIYECFSHGVFSGYMVCAFAIPLFAGALPAWIIRKHGIEFPLGIFYHFGIITLTIGCILEGVLRIYGTTNQLIYVFLIVGLLCLLLGGIKSLRFPRILWGAMVFAFSSYILLDTFVITQSYASEVVNDSITFENLTNLSADNQSNTPYTINVTTYEEYGTTIYVADITLSSMEYLKSAFADGKYGKNITDTVSDIASDNNAIIAINGDYYGVQERGYVIRNGILYRSTARQNQEDLVIYADGSYEIVNESDITAEELLEMGAYQLLSFGPALIEDSTITVTKNAEVAQAMTSNPRTAIGFVEEGHLLFVVADGRTSSSEGLSLYELAEFMQSLGATTAYNLDGGGSSTMVYQGEVVNNPTTNGRTIKERAVSDILYIGQ